MTQRKLLVVEDEFFIRELAVEILAELGHPIVEAATAHEALEITNTMAADELIGVVTDIQMPGALDGLDLAIAIREKFPSAAILLVSGRHLPQDRPRPARAQYMSKPWSFDSLTQAVKELIAQEEART